MIGAVSTIFIHFDSQELRDASPKGRRKELKEFFDREILQMQVNSQATVEDANQTIANAFDIDLEQYNLSLAAESTRCWGLCGWRRIVLEEDMPIIEKVNKAQKLVLQITSKEDDLGKLD